MVGKHFKFIYTLEQSPKIWQDISKQYLIRIGFINCKFELCPYIRVPASNILAIYIFTWMILLSLVKKITIVTL